MKFSARQLAEYLQGEVIGNPEVTVSSFAKIEEGAKGSISFLANTKYTSYIYTTQSDIVLVSKDFVAEKPISATLIKVENPYQSLATLMALAESTVKPKAEVSSLAVVSSQLQIDSTAYIAPFVCIGADCVIHKNVAVYPHTYIGNNVTVGENTIIYSGVRIYSGCKIGNNCVIHSGAVIGADGFGFAPQEDGTYHKIPQIGNVVIEDDVEIGANTTIDRATMGSTYVRKGAKIDNLVMLAHNTEVGKNSILVGQVGVAGSAKIGENCIIAGQAGISGHLTIGDKSKLGPQVGIISNVAPESEIIGTPALGVKEYFRAYAVFRKLPELQQTIRSLEKELKELKLKIE